MAIPIQSTKSYGFKLPPLELVRALFDYDPETGLLIRKIGIRGGKKGDVVGTKNSHGHLICRVDYTIYYVHRLVWLHCYGECPPQLIDHINGDRADNRINNLRPADFCGNSRNRSIQRNNKTGFRGVSFVKNDRKYKAYIKVGGKTIHLGYFVTAEAASVAYEAASLRYHREFSRGHQ